MSESCNMCHKPSSEVNLKRCAKCRVTQYCSRDCQKADWKFHKKICVKQAGGEPAPQQAGGNLSSSAGALSSFTTPTGAASSGPTPSGSAPSDPPHKGLERTIDKPFTRLDQGTWLHDRPETDVYRLLIDTYRLRLEDNYIFEGVVEEDSIYGEASNELAGFQRFLDLVATRAGLLPPWWSASKRKECESFGMDGLQWQDLRRQIEKGDIVEHYGDGKLPMQLRMFGEAVYGRGPGGQAGAPMRQTLMAMEGGDMGDVHMRVLDMSQFRP
ncbi:hypothetical protein ACO1O0_000095 [Amphichorda felina]